LAKFPTAVIDKAQKTLEQLEELNDEFQGEQKNIDKENLPDAYKQQKIRLVVVPNPFSKISPQALEGANALLAEHGNIPRPFKCGKDYVDQIRDQDNDGVHHLKEVVTEFAKGQGINIEEALASNSFFADNVTTTGTSSDNGNSMDMST